MSINVATISTNQTFGSWLTTTNRIATIISQNTLTLDTTTTGSVSTGNSYVNGYFGANYLYANTGLSGGSLGSPNTLSIISNTVFQNGVTPIITVTGNASMTNVIMTPNVFTVTPSISINLNGPVVNITSNTTAITSNAFNVNAVVTIVGNTIIYSNSSFAVATFSGNSSTSSIQLNAKTLSFTGNTTFANAVAITGAATLSSTLSVASQATIGSTLAVSGAANALSTLGVTGATTLANTLSVTGNTVLSNTITVTGNAVFSNTLAVTGNVALSNTLIVSGATQVLSLVSTGLANVGTANIIGNTAVGGVLTVAGNTTVTGNLVVSSSAAVTGTINCASFNAANATAVNVVNGSLTVVGVLQAGTWSGTMVSSGNYIPSTNNFYTIGSSTNVWMAGYFTTVYASNVSTSAITVAGNTYGQNILPTTNNSFVLGNTTNWWLNAFINSLTVTTANVGSINLSNAAATSVVNGNINIIGSIQSPNVVFTGTTTGNLVPSTNATFNLGNSSITWATGYISNITSNNISVQTVNAVTANITGVFGTSGNVTVGGILTVNNSTQILSNTYVFNNTSATANIDLFLPSVYRSAEYVLQLTDTTTVPASYHVTKLLLVHDGVTPYTTEYGTIWNNINLGNVSAGINGGYVFVSVTPASANVTVKFTRTTIAV